MELEYDPHIPQDIKELVENKAFRQKRRWASYVWASVITGVLVVLGGLALALLGYFYFQQECVLYTGVALCLLPWVTFFLYAFIIRQMAQHKMDEIREEETGHWIAIYRSAKEHAAAQLDQYSSINGY